MVGGSNKLVSAAAAAELLDIGLSTLYHNWRAWGLRGFRIGKLLKFRERDLEFWLKKHEIHTA